MGGSGANAEKGKRRYWAPPNANAEELPRGTRGFLASCQERCENKATADVHRMLDEFWEKDEAGGGEGKGDADKEAKKEEQAGDVDKALEKELGELRSGDGAKKGNNPFRRVDIGCRGTLYICANDGAAAGGTQAELGARISDTARAILEDVSKSQRARSRFLNRFLPVEDVCVAKPEDIGKAAAPIIARHLGRPEDDDKDKAAGKPSHRYAVAYEHRLATKLDRLSVINAVVAGVPKRHVVNLDEPEFVIIVTHIKNSAAITVVRDYYELAKYNLSQAARPPEERDGYGERQKRLAEKAKKRAASDDAGAPPAKSARKETDG